VFKFCVVVVVGDNYRQSTREESRSRVDAINVNKKQRTLECACVADMGKVPHVFSL